MTDNTDRLLKTARKAADDFYAAMLALGWNLSDEQKVSLRRLVPMREFERGVDTIDSIGGRLYLPCLMTDCMDEVLNGTNNS